MTRTVQTLTGPAAWRHETGATLRLAWPLILSNLTMALIGATDVLMLGWLGARELAGATLGFNLAMSCAIFCMGLITASAPMMASEIGRMAHSVRDVRRTFRQAIWAAVSVIVPFWFLLWNTEQILVSFGQQPDLARIAGTYISAYMWSVLPFLGFIILRNFVSALEQPVWALVVSVIGVLANALFNYALIFGNFGVPAFGVAGAGIGSVMTNVLMFASMALVVMLHPRFRRYRLFGRFWRSDWQRFRALWKLGLPIGITMGLEGSVFGIAALLMGLINAESVAAHAIALQLASLTFMVPMGLGQAATVRVGIQYGRRDHPGIARAGWVSFVLGTGFMAAMALVLLLAPEFLIGLFIDADAPGNAKVATLAVSFLAIAAIFQIVDGAQVVGAGMLRGLHDTTVPMIFALMGYWFIGIGVGAGLAFWQGWEGVGVWVGLASGLGIVAVLMLARWSMRARLGLLPNP
ncbi:multidrug resistance protein, MATE family [Parasphingorhabdus marina DSM 22363]|uniref:Multidrug resistance protein, MATE family n=1 Tax=Parasphingorhabdus marina DSM 22363 TaxID=1123272 RepID=A0A1N6GN48_9SPHN|nr:MATE family efflux transporter [Parasphingorhabdus marina]SIO08938.1 multidrug resistance protein, MATE family [Parasphingorhabdus marina DSM 22363]